MRCRRETMLLYAVTDRAWTGEQTLYEQVEQALDGGVTCVQLREKGLAEEAFLAEAMEIGALCRAYGVPFLINDSVEIALACGADGVHVGGGGRGSPPPPSMTPKSCPAEICRTSAPQWTYPWWPSAASIGRTSWN